MAIALASSGRGRQRCGPAPRAPPRSPSARRRRRRTPRARQRGHADLLARASVQSASSYPVSLSIAARTAALSACLASRLRTIDASSCCSSVSAKSISRSASSDRAARWYAGVPQAPTSARTRVIQRLRSSSRGVADRAVHLERRPGGEVRRVAGARPWPPRRRHGSPQRRAEHQRPGEVEGDPHVGQPVLDRLVGADRRGRTACAACTYVDRVVQQVLAEPEQLGRRRQHGEVERARWSRTARSRPLETTAGRSTSNSRRVGSTDRAPRRPRPRHRLAVDHEHACRPRPRRARSGTCGGTATVATSSTLAPEQHRQVRRGLDPRARDGVPAERLERHARRVRPGVAPRGPATVDALLGQPLPELEPGLGVAAAQARATATVSAAASSSSSADAKSRCSSVSTNLIGRRPFGSRGRPRMRSATMLRWISLVPA